MMGYAQAAAQSMMQPIAQPAMAGAGGGGGGAGDTYEIHIDVPLEILRDEPHLQQNAETLAEEFMRVKRSRGQ